MRTSKRYEEIRDRIGRFKIIRDIIGTCPDEVQKVMGEMIIVRAELSYLADAVEYEALSELFEDIGPNRVPPEYNIFYNDPNDGIRAERVKPGEYGFGFRFEVKDRGQVEESK